MTFLTAQTAFYYMASASVVSSLLAVTRMNPVHCMLWVLALFLHVAGIFLLLGAEFLAAVQVVVYAGAILVFYLFVLMLLDLPGEEAGPRFGKHWPFAAAGGLGFAALAWLAQVETPDSVVGPDRRAELESVGAGRMVAFGDGTAKNDIAEGEGSREVLGRSRNPGDFGRNRFCTVADLWSNVS